MNTHFGRPLDDLRAMDLHKEVHRPWGVIIPSSGLTSGYIPIISRPGAKETWKPSTPPVPHLVAILVICLAMLWFLIAVDAGLALGALYLVLPIGIILYVADFWALHRAAEDRQSRTVDETHLKYVRLLDRLFVAQEMGLVDSEVVNDLYRRTYEFVSKPISHVIICGESSPVVLERDLKAALEKAAIMPRTMPLRVPEWEAEGSREERDMAITQEISE